MTSQTSTEYEKYYVPESSKLAVSATIGLILAIFGAASLMNDLTFTDAGEITGTSWTIFYGGLGFFVATLFVWFVGSCETRRISKRGPTRSALFPSLDDRCGSCGSSNGGIRDCACSTRSFRPIAFAVKLIRSSEAATTASMSPPGTFRPNPI